MLQPLLRTFSSSSSSSLYSTISDSDDNSSNNSDNDVPDEELSQVAASTVSTSSSSSSSGNLLPLIIIDNWIIRKVIKISNHIPALASIAYFGLISSASMMNLNHPSSMAADKTATLMSVLTKRIGTTSNKEFSNYFSTLITPPSWIFLIWPFISVVQLITVMYSAIRSSSSSSSSSSSTSTTGNDNNDDDGDDGAAAPAVAVLKQDDLTALSLSNLMASFWLYFSSKATKDYLPLGSVLILPLVPLLSGYPVRLKQRKQQQQQNKQTETTTTKARPLFVFQVYSSFTTIAAFLALTQELQYGGRVLPFIFHNKPELCAMVFLSLIGYVVSRPSKNNVVSKIINTSILWGIVSKRNIDSFALLSASAAASSISTSTSTIAATVIVKRNLITLIGLFGSISYFTTTILAIISTIKLFNFFSNSV
jgi:hypothetical protein